MINPMTFIYCSNIKSI